MWCFRYSNKIRTNKTYLCSISAAELGSLFLLCYRCRIVESNIIIRREMGIIREKQGALNNDKTF